MNRVFIRETEKLKEALLRQAGEVESRLTSVLKGVETRDAEDLATLIDLDHEIDTREVVIEEDCLKILALHQPVARDLRFVIAILKINNDLERIGDVIVNIADRGIRLATFPTPDILGKALEMGTLAGTMLSDSINALVTLDLALAKNVIERDDSVDRLNHEVVQTVINRVKTPENAGSVEALILVKSMARDIERIGDHATNIAEDVAYLVDGTIIRHK